MLGVLERIEDGTQSELVTDIAATDGFLVVDRGSNSIVTARTYIGPTPEDEALIGWNEITVPVPAGWSWRVEVGNAAWADLRVTWVPLEPAAE